MNHAVQLLVCHGDAVLFVWIFAEQAGLPIPTVPLLLAVGSLARAGRMNFSWSVGLALAACLMADGLWYQIGRWRGTKVLRLLSRISPEPDLCLCRTKAAFRRHGANTLLVAKFVPGLNLAAPPLAAISGVSPLRFLIFDSIATIFWSGGYMMLGYIFSGQFERVATYSLELGTILVVVLVAATIAFIGVKLIHRQRFRREPWVARITPEGLKRKLASGEELAVEDV